MAEKPPLVKRLRAAKAYSDFHGEPPSRSYTVNLDDDPVAGYRLGSTLGIAYQATRDGKTERYFHEFKPKARPDLVVRDDGKRLYLANGAYKVTDRGIEDMPAMFVVNPSKRPSLRSKRKPAMARRARRRRTVQQAVFRANPVRRRRHSGMFAAAPKRRRRRRAPATIYTANPIRRRSHRRISRRSYRRNPIGGSSGGNVKIHQLVLPAAAIGLGAVGSELLMGYIPGLPSFLTTGVMRHVTKGVISAAAGWGIARFANKKMGEAFALGGMTIAFHDAIKEGIVAVMPTAQFGAYLPANGGSVGRPARMGYYSPGSMVPMNRMGQYMPPRGGMAGAYRASDGGGQPDFGG